MMIVTDEEEAKDLDYYPNHGIISNQNFNESSMIGNGIQNEFDNYASNTSDILK